jgi:hypothetical protein
MWVYGTAALMLVGCGQVMSSTSDASIDAAALGAPCTKDDDCLGALCLGGPFTGGFCSSPVGECDPGSGTFWCGDGGACKKTGATDVDDGAVGEYCLGQCSTVSDCRAGYMCCPAQEYASLDASVCAPASLCPDQ